MSTSNQPPTVDVVIVNWNSGECLRHALKSLEDRREDGYRLERVIVVDNASSDGSEVGIPTVDGRLLLDRAPFNLGFGRACNRGAGNGRGHYILFLNPDTVVSP